MPQITKHSAHHISPVATLILTLIFSLCCCLYLSSLMPAQKRGIDYLAQGLFSALLAVPSGTAWRSWRKARAGRWTSQI